MTTTGGTPTVPAAPSDGDALDKIAELLRDDADGVCGPYLPDAIAEIVRATGRTTGRTP
jgi:hypothetical protein